MGLHCEMCGKPDTEVELGDWHGVVACFDCGESDPELKAWRDKTNREFGFGILSEEEVE